MLFTTANLTWNGKREKEKERTIPEFLCDFEDLTSCHHYIVHYYFYYHYHERRRYNFLLINSFH